MVQNLHKEVLNEVRIPIQKVKNVKDVVFFSSPWNRQHLH